MIKNSSSNYWLGNCEKAILLLEVRKQPQKLILVSYCLLSLSKSDPKEKMKLYDVFRSNVGEPMLLDSIIGPIVLGDKSLWS